MVHRLEVDELRFHVNREAFLNGSGLDPWDIELRKDPRGQLDRIGIVYRDPVTGELMRGENGKPFVRDRIFHPKDRKYDSPPGAGIRLYFPPHVLDHLDQCPRCPIYVTEGEKKAARATARGLPCIGIGGIDSWSPKREGKKDARVLHPDFNLIPNLAGRRVVMVHDSDAREPEKAADFERAYRDFKKACRAAGIREVTRCILPSDGADKVGLDDYLLHHNRQQFLRLVEEQSEITNLNAHILNGKQLAEAKFLPVHMIVDPWLADSSLMMLHGAAGVGKSYFLMAMAEAVTREDPTEFLNWKVREQAGVLLVDGEMPAYMLQDRARRLGLLNRDNFSLLPCVELSRSTGRTIALDNPDWRDLLGAAILKHPARVVILDNLASLATVEDENDSGAWNAINAWLISLRAAGKSIILVHHSGKGGDQRGTSHRSDNLDTVIKLTEHDGETRVSFDKARNFGGPQRKSRKYTMDVSEDAVTLEVVEEENTEDRDGKILAAVRGGEKQADVALRFGIGRSRVSQIVAKDRQRQAVLKIAATNLTPAAEEVSGD